MGYLVRLKVGVGWVEWGLICLEPGVGSDGWALDGLKVGIKVVLVSSLMIVLFTNMSIIGNVKVFSSWHHFQHFTKSYICFQLVTFFHVLDVHSSQPRVMMIL